MIRMYFLILAVIANQTVHADELELIYYRAPAPLDWTSPGSLSRSTYKNMLHEIPRMTTVRDREGTELQVLANVTYPHSISHVNVKIQCGQSAPIYRGSKATKSTASYAYGLFVDKVGLESLVTPVPGTFYENDEILDWLPILKEQGYVRSLKLRLSGEQCQRVETYLRQLEAMGQNKIYGGLRSNPRLGQGAGCAAFAISFLEVLELLRPEFKKSWQRHLDVPVRLVRTDRSPSGATFLDYLTGRDEAWAREGEPHFSIDFWDPELTYRWLGDVAQGKTAFDGDIRIESRGRFQSVVWDVRSRTGPFSSPLFPMGLKRTAANTKRILTELDRVSTLDALLKPLHFECARLGYCDARTATWK